MTRDQLLALSDTIDQHDGADNEVADVLNAQFRPTPMTATGLVSRVGPDIARTTRDAALTAAQTAFDAVVEEELA